MENMDNTQNPKKPNMKWMRITGTVFIAVCILVAGFGGGLYYQTYQNRNKDTVTVSQVDKSEVELFNQALTTIQKNYVDQSAVNTQNLTYTAISGMVNSLGDTDHTVFLTPPTYSRKIRRLPGNMKGLGLKYRRKMEL